MEHLSTQKLFNSSLMKVTEDMYDISPCKKPEKNKKAQENDTEESPFSFSFSSFAPSEISKGKESRKVQFGFNLLTSYQNTLQIHAFRRLKQLPVKISPARRIFNLFNSKKKRAAFIKWYVNSIKISSDHKVTTALSTLNRLNSYSRKYISCSLLFSLFTKHFHIISCKFLSTLSSPPPPSRTPSKSKQNSSIPSQNSQSIFTGFLFLQKLFEKRKAIHKINTFKLLSDDISLQRKAFIQNTDRCIMLSEQLFEAKDSKEKAEFEKEELIAVLESKTDELDKVLDVLEEYKSWQGKLTSIEKAMKEEVQHWKAQATWAQAEFDKKNNEIIEVYSDKKKAEEECLKAYRNLDAAQRQTLELQQKCAELENNGKKECGECEGMKKDIATYNELIEEFKKSEETYMAQIKDMQELISRPSSVISQKSKSKPVKKAPKKVLELDKQPISESENQFALEVVNLHKQLNKLKHENRTLSEILKK